MGLQPLLNSAFRIDDRQAAVQQAEEFSKRSDVRLAESVTRVKDSPAVQVMLSKQGAVIVMSWADRSKTILQVSLPIKNAVSFPAFHDFSSLATAHNDTVVKFNAHPASIHAERAKDGKSVLLLGVELCLASDMRTAIETFSIELIKGKALLTHKNISGVAPPPKPAEDNDESIDNLDLTNLPEVPQEEDGSGSWDIDDLMKDDG